MDKAQASSNGIGFTGLLTIAFIVLKLTNYITWSWWWLLSPLLLGAAFVFIAVILYLIALWAKR